MIFLFALTFGVDMALSAVPDSFDVVSTVDGEPIGWMKVHSCDESSTSTFTYADGLSASDFVPYFPHVIAIQFLANDKTPEDYNFNSPRDDFVVMTEICSKPVIALNNNLDLSWPIDVRFLQNPGISASSGYVRNNWKGTSTARARLVQGGDRCNCPPQDPRNIYDPAAGEGLFLYWACCNQEGIHLTVFQCSWDWQDDLPGIEGMSVWFGFAVNKDKCCAVQGRNGVLTTDCPTLPDPCDEAVGGYSNGQPRFVGKNFIDGFVTISTSIFYVLFGFAIIGVFSLFGWSVFGIKTFVASQNQGVVKFEKVENMEEDEVCLK